MSERDGYKPSVPSWVAIIQPEPGKAVDFYYAELFDWEAVNLMPPESPGKYLLCKLRNRDVATVVSQHGALPPPVPVGGTYIWVDTAAKATKAGGSAVCDPCDSLGGRTPKQEDENRRTNMLLENKNAIIYGPGGGIGGGVARAFAREGAKVFLAGRTRESLEAVATDIAATSGSAEVAVVDALDERAVEEHAQAVVSQVGSIDVSFNLITRGDVQGTSLVEMTTDDLLHAVVNGLRSNFLTARAALRRMIAQEAGVILHLNSASGAGAMPGMGSTGPADEATEAFMRYPPKGSSKRSSRTSQATSCFHRPAGPLADCRRL